MIERKALNKLVVETLDGSGSMKASMLYCKLQTENPKVLLHEKVRGFRSFVKILNQFNEIQQENETGTRQYTLKKGFK